MYKFFLIFLILLFSLSLSLNLYSTETRKPKYRIVTENFPPFNYKENGQLQGISIDIFKSILNSIGWSNKKNDIELLPWKKAYKTALNEPNTIIFSMTRTSSRENKFKWAGPIATNYWNLYSLKIIEGKTIDYAIYDLNDAKIYSVGVQYGGAMAKYLEAEGFNHINYSETVPDVVDKLFNFKTQLIAVQELVLYSILRQKNISYKKVRNVYNIRNKQLYIGFNKNIPDNIVQKFQNAIKQLKQNGEYDRIMNKYYDIFVTGIK